MGPPAGMQEKQDKGLQRLKRAVTGMKRAIAQMQKVVDKVIAAGYSAPAEVTAAIASATAAVDVISNATTIDDTVMDAMDKFNDFTDVLDANMENLAVLSNFPRITKQADRELTRIQANFEKAKTKLANVAFDTVDIFANVQEKIDALKKTYDEAVAFAKTGKAEDAFTKMQDEFFPNLEDAHQSVGMLNALKGLSRAGIGINKGIKAAEKIVAKLQKFKITTTELSAIITQSKAKLEEFNAYLKTKNFDPDVAVDMIEQLEALRDSFDEKVDALTEGKEDTVGNIQPLNFFGGVIPKAPRDIQGGFDKMGTSGGTVPDGIDTSQYGF